VTRPSAPADGEPTSFREVARGGLDRVHAAVERDDWTGAADEARRLKRIFAAESGRFGPIPSQVFDGVLAACMARDREELADFTDLVGEMFP
jgi:hypothetical protein